MADFWKGLQDNLKRGYTATQIVDSLASDDKQIAQYVESARSAGHDDRDIVIGIGEGLTKPSKAADPYAQASSEMGARRAFVPLGAAMMAPVHGIKQILGDEQAGLSAVEAQKGIARTIPGGEAGMTAGKIGLASLAMAPLAPIGVTAAGARGVAMRAGSAGGGVAATEAVQPMGEGQGRAIEATKSGAISALATPFAEGAIRGASAIVSPVVQKVSQYAARTGKPPSGAAIEQELVMHLRAQGVDYAKLDADMRRQLLSMTREALSPENLSQNALVRAARVEQTIGVPATRGQAERSTELMRNEQQFGGEAIMRREAAQNEALRSKLEGLATARGGSLDPMQQGASFRSATLARQADTDRAISEAYKVADETVGDVPVSIDAIGEIINKNPVVPGVDTLIAKLKKAGIKFDDAGDVIAGQSIPARYMGEIRKVASAMTQSPDRAGIGKAAKDAIDDTFEGSGIGQYAEAVSRARAGFRQFDDRQIPAGISATRKGVEDITATSKLSDWVMAKSPEQLKELKEFFARGNEKKLREFYGNKATASGVQAVKDLKASAIGAVLNKGLRKSATAEGGTWTTSPEAIVTAYRQFGGGSGPAAIARADAKMRAILGPRDFAEFKRIIQVAEDLSVPGRAQMKGSAEANTGLAMRIMGLIGMSPAAGIEAAGAVKGVAQSVSAKKSAQWSASEQAKAMRKPVLPASVPAAAGRIGSLSSLMGDK